MIPRAGFVLDLGRCVGCGACVLACRLEDASPSSSTTRRRMIALNEVRHPGGPTYFLSLACHHCERPACVSACPSGAYERRPDGIVLHHDEFCLGCRYCEMACPFGGPRFDQARAVMTKCDFCRTRSDAGDAPACVAACPTDALRVLLPCDRGEDARDVTAASPEVPGFEDPTGCQPSIRFKLPRGIRGRRLQQLLKAMTQIRNPRRAPSVGAGPAPPAATRFAGAELAPPCADRNEDD